VWRSRMGAAWLGREGLGVMQVWHGNARSGTAGLGMAVEAGRGNERHEHGKAGWGRAWTGDARRSRKGWAGRGMTWLGTVWLGRERSGAARSGEAVEAGRGTGRMARHGTLRSGEVWLGEARRSWFGEARSRYDWKRLGWAGQAAEWLGGHKQG
jgi:hypothetical protein